jgi:hypothetical protein
MSPLIAVADSAVIGSPGSTSSVVFSVVKARNES